ncbi:SusC/RagA family TonB-linked outer membrane protein [Niabella insulamsoli]|uniref:SusC/RagA family TonB-linked outer membrane protein n=1 Tax=Niabella insulamsoli TaxID=3144874 RepID=UPI0031FDCB2C
MRKSFMPLLLSLVLLTALPGFAWAQQRTVTGVVSNTAGQQLTGATIVVRGTTLAATTDANGRFTISAATGNVLEFSHVGYETRTITLKNETQLAITLTSSTNDLDEVVVVAMDQKRNPRSLSFSTQTVDGEDIKDAQRENFVNSLQGRVAGITINPTSGTAGASSQIVLRGFNSMSLDNSPLFVIDGIILDNSTTNTGALTGTSENRREDFTNRVADLNPNDIASITVLKGPEATALYGSQASSGAIIITTKKGGTKGIKINYDNSFRFSRLTRFPETISLYNNGTNGDYSETFTSFGPKYADTTTLYPNYENFFKTGFAQTHNLSVDFGGKVSSFRVSGSIFDQDGFIPANNYNRYNLRITNNTKIGKWIEINPQVAFSNSTNRKVLRGASGYLLNLLTWPADNDIRDWETSDGLKKPLFAANPNGEVDNPFYNVYRNPGEDKTNRITTTLGINLTPFKWLTVNGRFGYDTYRTEGYQQYDSMSYYLTRAQRGWQRNYQTTYYGYNHFISATGTKDFGKLTTRLMAGTQWQDYESQTWSVNGNNLTSMARTDSSNTDPTTRQYSFNLQFRNGTPNYYLRRQLAYFAEAMIGWDNALFLTYSHRFESNSIFPRHSRNYNYPAGGVSAILSDLIPGFKSSVSAVNYWKVRASVANTARTAGPYDNQSAFNFNTGSGGGFYYGFTNANPGLTPERQSTYEIGTEFRFLKNRLSLDATYYNTRNKNLIVQNFRLSYGTGFVLNTMNIGATENRGLELVVNAEIAKQQDFGWTMIFNFNKMWNEITELPSNIPEFYISDTWMYDNARGGGTLNNPTTTITGSGYLRNNAGQILINPLSGLPVIDANFLVRGDRNPDFTLGWINKFNYKKFSLSMLWDLKVGGDIFNATEMYLTDMGRSTRTADREVPRVVDGVLQDGLENTDNPTKNTIVVTPFRQQGYYTALPVEEFIQKDVNWFRLRDITLAYSFSQQQLSFLKAVKSLGAFVTLTDPILITNYRGADPQVNGNTSGSAGVGGYGFDYGNVGMPLSVNIGLRVGF